MKELTDAILFAARSHAGQYRKDGRTPYINHPLEVMHLLINTADVTTMDILVAAVLHDVVEDTTITLHELSNKFGKKVAGLVDELTDDKLLSKIERKKSQLERANLLSADARLIRISDKICNVYDVIYSPPGAWEIPRRLEYIGWAESVVGKIRGTNAGLENRFDELLGEGKRFLGT